jgi:hypothetical protein
LPTFSLKTEVQDERKGREREGMIRKRQKEREGEES